MAYGVHLNQIFLEKWLNTKVEHRLTYEVKTLKLKWLATEFIELIDLFFLFPFESISLTYSMITT